MMRRTGGWQVMALPSLPVRLQEEGWSLSELPPGFQLAGCVRKPVVMPASESRTDPSQAPTLGPRPDTLAPDTLHAVFSDGMTRVSMFIEPRQPGRPAQSLATRLGATHTLAQPLGEHWRLVLMGDVPITTLRRFAAAVERR